MRLPLVLAVAFKLTFTFAQSGDFPFGKISYKELGMKIYPADSNAQAVVLNEYGYAEINENQKLVFVYHTRIKVLKSEGVAQADFKFPLYKNGIDEEIWRSLDASTFNEENGSIKESKFDSRNFFMEKTAKNVNLAKFALPNVKVGSIIEVKYVTESPFFFNFHSWEFQDDIPKLHSEYQCKIPANWIYNISLVGFYKLSKSESVVKQDCYQIQDVSVKAPCLLTRYAMDNIPAFRKEQYMTAKKNFLSSVQFELLEFQRFDGSKVKYAEEWKDVDKKLLQEESFGLQIKKARNIMENIILPMVSSEKDSVKKAQLIYDYIKHSFLWNGNYGKFTELGMKQLLEQKKGNVADLNLMLLGALQAADLDADPVLISTRDNGLPVKIHPQRNSFNYVVVRMKAGGQQFLLDATDSFLPFGVLPIRCLNDQGRLINRSKSGWIDLKAAQKQKKTISMDLKLLDGIFKGNLVIQSVGYEGQKQRKEIGTDQNIGNYKSKFAKKLNAEVSNFQIENREDLTKPLVERMEIQIPGFESMNAETFYLNPYLIDRYASNPFKSAERHFPVDLGAPIETNYYISIELPESITVVESPPNASYALPNGGGKCFVAVTTQGNKITLTSVISLAKSIYSADEYHSLREFFSRVVQQEQAQFVFKKVKKD